MEIKDRIQSYLDFKKIKVAAFEKEVGMSNGYWRNTKNISAKMLELILRKYSDLSPSWILLEEGSMIRSISPAPSVTVVDSAGSVVNQGTAKTISTDPSLSDLYESIKKKDQQIEKLIDLLTNKYPSTLS